jgi:hypothetical protein
LDLFAQLQTTSVDSFLCPATAYDCSVLAITHDSFGPTEFIEGDAFRLGLLKIQLWVFAQPK